MKVIELSSRSHCGFSYLRFFFLPLSVVPVTGQRHHTQLLSKSHQKVQVHEASVRLHLFCLNNLVTLWVCYRPAAGAAVRWPVLTPLKRKGVLPCLNPQCLNVCPVHARPFTNSFLHWTTLQPVLWNNDLEWTAIIFSARSDHCKFAKIQCENTKC